MTKTKWVNQSLVVGLLSLAAGAMGLVATGCAAGSSSTEDGEIGEIGDPGLRPGELPAGGGVEPEASPFPQPNRVPLPIVLLQGGLSLQGDILPLNYFFGVQDRLTNEGYQVFAPQVDPLLGVAERAAQLGPQINLILQQTGASRVHLVGHGQGGFDARYLVSSLDFGDRVATVTTIGTPHHGTLVADVAAGLVPGPVVNILAFVTQVLGAGDEDAITNLNEMTIAYAEQVFDPENLPDSRISYFSIAGKTNVLTLDLFNEDICNPLLLVGHLLLLGQGPNDGLVTVASAQYGEFLGVIPADNLDQVGQLLGLVSLPFDHLDFYSELANFLTDENVANPL
jgi:triacylglycerol esterase/lipase EstA (alpha/beta hydrolase family)